MRNICGHAMGTALTGADKWAQLATSLHVWAERGVPVAQFLTGLPAGSVMAANDPAAYARKVLQRRIAAHERGQQTATSEPGKPARAAPGWTTPPTRDRTAAAASPHPAEPTAARPAKPAPRPAPSPGEPASAAQTAARTYDTSAAAEPSRPRPSPRPRRPAGAAPATGARQRTHRR